MGFSIHGFSPVVLHPGSAVKPYFSVPVALYTVFSGPKTLVKTLAKNLVKNLVKNLIKNLAKNLANNP